jgi:hypothetical protein
MGVSVSVFCRICRASRLTSSARLGQRQGHPRPSDAGCDDARAPARHRTLRRPSAGTPDISEIRDGLGGASLTSLSLCRLTGTWATLTRSLVRLCACRTLCADRPLTAAVFPALARGANSHYCGLVMRDSRSLSPPLSLMSTVYLSLMLTSRFRSHSPCVPLSL